MLFVDDVQAEKKKKKMAVFVLLYPWQYPPTFH